jgi:hypothetical protein
MGNSVALLPNSGPSRTRESRRPVTLAMGQVDACLSRPLVVRRK